MTESKVIQTEDLPPRPWTIEPLKGKYYGTEVSDANGDHVCSIWREGLPPSEREIAFAGDRTWPDDWEYDNHSESAASLAIARLLVETANAI